MSRVMLATLDRQAAALNALKVLQSELTNAPMFRAQAMAHALTRKTCPFCYYPKRDRKDYTLAEHIEILHPDLVR